MRNTSALALAVALSATTAHAGDNELTLSTTDRALRTSSANAVTAESLTGGALGYARNLGSRFIPHLELWVNGSFAWGAVDGTMFQKLSTELRTLGFIAGAQLRYNVHRRITASARIDLGAARAALEIRDSMNHSASDDGWGALTSGGAGLDAYVIRARRFALAFRLEVGVVATSSIPLTATPDAGDEDTLHLEMTAASLGSLNLSGPWFAASFVGQF
jgi:hypothetical protein